MLIREISWAWRDNLVIGISGTKIANALNESQFSNLKIVSFSALGVSSHIILSL